MCLYVFSVSLLCLHYKPQYLAVLQNKVICYLFIKSITMDRISLNLDLYYVFYYGKDLRKRMKIF